MFHLFEDIFDFLSPDDHPAETPAEDNSHPVEDFAHDTFDFWRDSANDWLGQLEDAAQDWGQPAQDFVSAWQQATQGFADQVAHWFAWGNDASPGGPGRLKVRPTGYTLCKNVYPRSTMMRVSKWGNSLAVRLPAEGGGRLGLKEGDEVDFNADPLNTHSLSLVRRLTKAEAMEKLRSLRGLMPADYKFNRDEANER